MARLELKDVRKSFGTTEVLKGIDLVVEDGEFVAFVGPSGCGKSTLLRLICGLDEITAGELAIDGEIVNDVPPAKRGIAMVFQSYALYPHMSVAREHGVSRCVSPARRRPKSPGASRRRRSASHRPTIWSASRASSRAASASASPSGAPSCASPHLPFRRAAVQSRRGAAGRDADRDRPHEGRLGTTMVYVTHDQIEAMTLADKIVVLNAGRVEQVGSPLDSTTSRSTVSSPASSARRR